MKKSLISLLATSFLVAPILSLSTVHADNIDNKLLINEVNRLRSQNNLPDLTVDETLQQEAHIRALKILNDGHVSHTGRNTKIMPLNGENLAIVPVEHKTKVELANETIKLLYIDNGFDDLSHRKNMLLPYYKHIGVDSIQSPKDGRQYMAFIFGTTDSEMRNNNWYNNDFVKGTIKNIKEVGLLTNTKYDSVDNPNDDLHFKAVVTVLNRAQVFNFHNNEMVKVPGKRLEVNTPWYTDTLKVINGVKYYRVSTNEWIKQLDVYM